MVKKIVLINFFFLKENKWVIKTCFHNLPLWKTEKDNFTYTTSIYNNVDRKTLSLHNKKKPKTI